MLCFQQSYRMCTLTDSVRDEGLSSRNITPPCWCRSQQEANQCWWGLRWECLKVFKILQSERIFFFYHIENCPYLEMKEIRSVQRRRYFFLPIHDISSRSGADGKRASVTLFWAQAVTDLRWKTTTTTPPPLQTIPMSQEGGCCWPSSSCGLVSGLGRVFWPLNQLQLLQQLSQSFPLVSAWFNTRRWASSFL